MEKPKPTKSPMALILEAVENQTKVTEALRLEVAELKQQNNELEVARRETTKSMIMGNPPLSQNNI